jgi:MFS family permease
VLLTLAHDASWQIYVAMLIMGVGIGFAFASMANLIVESVPAQQTGIATGMNTIVRSIGGAIGAQASASIIAGTLSHGDFTEHGFTIAFGVAAGTLALGAGVALLIPSPRI